VAHKQLREARPLAISAYGVSVCARRSPRAVLRSGGYLPVARSRRGNFPACGSILIPSKEISTVPRSDPFRVHQSRRSGKANQHADFSILLREGQNGSRATCSPKMEPQAHRGRYDWVAVPIAGDSGTIPSSVAGYFVSAGRTRDLVKRVSLGQHTSHAYIISISQGRRVDCKGTVESGSVSGSDKKEIQRLKHRDGSWSAA
jgi:hypothetical protein